MLAPSTLDARLEAGRVLPQVDLAAAVRRKGELTPKIRSSRAYGKIEVSH
jgi:hypothetical protein